MKRKLSILFSFSKVMALALALSGYSPPTTAQTHINIVTFLDAVARVCGGTTSQQISTEGNNISLRTTEVTIDPGTGKLLVEKNGVLIAEQAGEYSQAYYQCVENLTKALGGAFSSPPRRDPAVEVGYPEPTQDEMLQAHSEQVSVGVLVMPIDRFEKAGCKPSSNVGYDCSYSIRAGGFGAPSFVTNTFAKAGEHWVMYWREK